MQVRRINAPDAPARAGGYAQAIDLSDYRRLLFISGQIPVDIAGELPEDFASQARVA